MPWQAAAPHAGFSSAAKTWLPVDARHTALAVDQQAGPDSLLGYFKQIIAWRKTQPALIHGDMHLWDAHAQTLVFVREHAGQRVLCAFNFSDRAAELSLPADWAGAQALNESGTSGVHTDAQRLRFEPWGCAFLSPSKGL
jgi:alpha-glucosidase